MKSFLGRSPGSSSRWLALPAGVAVALLAVGVALGAYFGSQATDGTSVAQESQQPTAALTPQPSPEPTASAATTPAADSSPTPAVTPEPSPEPTAAPASREFTPVPLGCPDCAVKGGHQLPVRAEDIQLGADGKYYVPDRGDGCTYREVDWGPLRSVGWVTLHDPDCEVWWEYLPATGEVQAWTS